MPALSLRTPTRVAVVAGCTVGMLGAVTLAQQLAPKHRRERVFESYMRPWAALLLEAMGTQVQISPARPSRAVGPRLVVANHRSALDIGIVLTYFGGSLVSRADLETWPLVGTCAKKAQTIFVDQTSRHSGLHAIHAIRDQLRRGRTVCVFPEGTTFAGDEIRPFARGVFSAARGLDVEIIPVGIAYPPGCEYTEDSFLSHLAKIARCQKTPVAVEIGAAQPVGKNAAKTAARLQGAVEALVHRARARLDT